MWSGYTVWLGRAYWTQQAVGAVVILHVSVAIFTAIAVGLSFSIADTEAVVGIAFGLTAPLMVGAHYLLYRCTRATFPLRKHSQLKDARRQFLAVIRQGETLIRNIQNTQQQLQDAIVMFRAKGVDTSDLEAVDRHMQAQLDDLIPVKATAEAALSRIEARLAKPKRDRVSSDEETVIPAELINSQMEAMAAMQQANQTLRQQVLHSH